MPIKIKKEICKEIFRKIHSKDIGDRIIPEILSEKIKSKRLSFLYNNPEYKEGVKEYFNEMVHFVRKISTSNEKLKVSHIHDEFSVLGEQKTRYYSYQPLIPLITFFDL